MMRIAVLAGMAMMFAMPATAQVVSDSQVTHRISGPDIEVTSGAAWTSGKYDSDRKTTILTVPIGVRASIGNFRVTANLPYMRVRTGGAVLSGIDGTPIVWSSDMGNPKRTYDGFGDVTLGASYALPFSPGGISVELGGKVKIPTAKRSQGITTGKTDYMAVADISKQIGGISPFATVSYRWFGDRPGINLRNGFAGSVGATAMAGPGTVIGSYDYARSASPLVKDAHELFLGYAVPVAGKFRVTGYGSGGLSSGAPGIGGGLLVSAMF